MGGIFLARTVLARRFPFFGWRASSTSTFCARLGRPGLWVAPFAAMGGTFCCATLGCVVKRLWRKEKPAPRIWMNWKTSGDGARHSLVLRTRWRGWRAVFVTTSGLAAPGRWGRARFKFPRHGEFPGLLCGPPGRSQDSGVEGVSALASGSVVPQPAFQASLFPRASLFGSRQPGLASAGPA